MPFIKAIFLCAITAVFPVFTANAAVIAIADLGASRYHLLDQNSNGTKWWFEFEAEAQTLGGHLATIEAAAENAFILNAFKPIAINDSIAKNLPDRGSISFFIGLSDHASEGTYVWSSGSSSPYRQWSSNQPQNTLVDEDFVGMLVNQTGANDVPGNWHDIVGDARKNDLPYGIAETTIPLPSTIIPMLTVASIASVAAIKRRRSR